MTTRDDEVPGLRLCTGPDDPRLHDVDTEFRELVAAFSAVTASGRETRRRLFHGRAAVLRGTLRFVDAPGVPVHPFLAAGRSHPVLARYSSGMSPDDLVPGVRGVSLRWLDPEDPTEPGRSPFALTLNTGPRLFVRDPAAFVAFALTDATGRAELVRTLPDDTAALLWEQVRDGALGLDRHHYHSQVPRVLVDATGRPWLVRYRLVPGADVPDTAHPEPGGRPLPPAGLERDPADPRPPTALRDDLSRRAEQGGVRALLQLQLHPLGADADANLAAVVPTRSWPEPEYPFRTVGELVLDEVVDEAVAEPALFDPAVAPEGLGITLGRSPREPAAVHHARSLIYRAAHAVRTEHLVPGHG
ncbi:hypothetical protein [Pseudonocardia sp. HH130630-07]|uniref:hypothetical protein n=1 Tax=Pseudonocardia sp. HH130630-07 TaxID=1690815 RepID=UPI0008151B7F|nr:hypothetical protein [Pseudonocardia sp. HH130630-07]ANY05814.1 hypothetical protein AFB00_05325 [Pseudonocardia sp. HH130630-07]